MRKFEGRLSADGAGGEINTRSRSMVLNQNSRRNQSTCRHTRELSVHGPVHAQFSPQHSVIRLSRSLSGIDPQRLQGGLSLQALTLSWYCGYHRCIRIGHGRDPRSLWMPKASRVVTAEGPRGRCTSRRRQARQPPARGRRAIALHSTRHTQANTRSFFPSFPTPSFPFLPCLCPLPFPCLSFFFFSLVFLLSFSLVLSPSF